jgi:hypothetical protein
MKELEDNILYKLATAQGDITEDLLSKSYVSNNVLDANEFDLSTQFEWI